jgi:Na+/melibiose symporter-like transporter
VLEFLGYIVHGTREAAAHSNAADVFNSVLNMAETATTIVVIILTTGLSARFGRKAIIVTGFSLCAVTTFCYYFVSPTNTGAMLVIRMLVSLFYAPTIAPAWASYADAADYSEWQTGRRFTGMVYATIGFALKSGLAFGSAVFLWLMVAIWHYDTKAPDAPNAVAGYHVSVSLCVAVIFAGGAIAIAFSKLNKATTLKMAAELEARRRQAGLAAAAAASTPA